MTEPADTNATPSQKAAQSLRTIVGAVLLALVIRAALVEPFEIEGASMEPTLLDGDRVLVAKFMYGLSLPFREEADLSWGSPSVGNVVIIHSPADGIDIVKRVIGVAGDTIEVRDDRVYRNGVALPQTELGPCPTCTGWDAALRRVSESNVGDHDFRISASQPGPAQYPIRIPPGHIYVLGDHRDGSNDSRNPAVGAISVTRVKGRALSIYWSSKDRSWPWNLLQKAHALRWDRMLHAVQ